MRLKYYILTYINIMNWLLIDNIHVNACKSFILLLLLLDDLPVSVWKQSICTLIQMVSWIRLVFLPDYRQFNEFTTRYSNSRCAWCLVQMLSCVKWFLATSIKSTYQRCNKLDYHVKRNDHVQWAQHNKVVILKLCWNKWCY